MKTFAIAKIDLVESLAITIAMRKEAEKREAELKAEVRRFMDGSTVLEAGNYIVYVSKRKRSGLDVDALKGYLGVKMEDYVKMTDYDTLEVCKLENS